MSFLCNASNFFYGKILFPLPLDLRSSLISFSANFVAFFHLSPALTASNFRKTRLVAVFILTNPGLVNRADK